MENGLISIVKNELSNGPINIVVDAPRSQSMHGLGLSIGDIVEKMPSYLLIGATTLYISLEKVRKWNPQILIQGRVSDLKIVERNFDLLKRLAVKEGRHDALGQLIQHEEKIFKNEKIRVQLNEISRRAYPHITALVQGIIHKRLDGLHENVDRLIGLGLGLTPSADDVLTGIMTSFSILIKYSLLDKKYLKEMNKAIRDSLNEGKTTLLSKEFLEHATRGDVSESIGGMIVAILTSSDDVIDEKVRKVLRMGETSGTDIIFGIILGLRLGLNLAY